MVGPTMAKSLLGHFKSIKSIVNASEKELQAVDNMGEKKAKKIVKLINAKFSEETGAEKTVSVESPAEEKTESDTPDDAAEE